MHFCKIGNACQHAENYTGKKATQMGNSIIQKVQFKKFPRSCE